MKFIKLFLIIASLITASNSYAGWSKELSVKGNGFPWESTAYYSEMHYFPSAGIYSGKLQVILTLQKNFIGTGGDGWVSAGVDFYLGGNSIAAEGRSIGVSGRNPDRKELTFTVSGVVDSFLPTMNVHVVGWRKGLSRVWLYY